MLGARPREPPESGVFCVFFMQHIFGIAPSGLCGGVFFIVCRNTSGSVFTATEGGIPRVAAFGVKAQDLLGLVLGKAIQAGDGTGRFGGSRGLAGCDRITMGPSQTLTGGST